MIHLRRSLPILMAAVLAVAVPWAGGRAGAETPPPVKPALVAAPGARAVSMKTLLEQAEQHNLQLQIAALQVPKARTALDRAKAAAAAGGQTLALALQQRYLVSLPPDDTTGTALRKSAELGLEQAALGLEAARQNVRLAVTKAYVEWQKADAQVAAGQAALTRAQAQADLARKAKAAGTASQYDVIQADAQVASQKAALAAAQAGREAARLALERLAGVALGGGARPEAPAEATPDAAADPDALVEQAQQNRPDVALGKLTVQAKEADLDLLAAYFPGDDPTVAAARLAVQEAALSLESTLADSELQVRQAVLTIGGARERLAALADGESQSREALRLAQIRFEAGSATSTEVIAAQAALSGAEAARIQARADLTAAVATLEQATGEASQATGVQPQATGEVP